MLNWTCTTCGRNFTRKDSVKRHIQRIHSSIGEVVQFSDYIVGRSTGIYKTDTLPVSNSMNRMDRYKEAFKSAFYDELGRQAAQIFYSEHLRNKKYWTVHALLDQIDKLFVSKEDITDARFRVKLESLGIDFMDELKKNDIA